MTTAEKKLYQQSMEEIKEIEEIEEIKKEDLVEITNIKIDPNASSSEKIKSYLEQIKNPYCFLCNDTVVKISFSEEGKELSELLKQYFTALKQ